MRNLISKLPKFKGKQKILEFFDQIFGVSVLKARNNIKLEGCYSSMQDMAFLRAEPENIVLEEALDMLPLDGVFIDVGANCGYYSSYAAQLLGSNGYVLSIEPSLREYRRLIFAHQHNSKICNWIPLNMAVGNSQSIVRLWVDAGHTGTNHITTDHIVEAQSCISVTIDSLVSWILPQGKIIDLIKIDVEGYEYNVLKGMEELLIRKRIVKLSVEITDVFLKRSGSSKDLLFQFMEQNGYSPTIKSDAWQYDELFVLRD